MDINVKKLTVKYNQRVVGYLFELEQKRIAFQYDDLWIRNGFSISPFSLPLSNEVFISKSKYFDGLYGVFNDSLPDGWGELLVRRMLAKKGINFDKISPLSRLTLISHNGLGGLSYEPTQNDDSPSLSFELDLLAKEVKKILEEHNGDVDLDLLYKFGGSSGGARPKAHLIISDTEWIVKFPSMIDPINIGEQEYLTNILAKNSGINTNDFKLFTSKIYKGFFGAKRFDRSNGKRIHMISLSASLETTHRIPNLDYMHLFQVIRRICVNQEDLYEAYRRMCFNVLHQNRDDHGKNHAFIYDEQSKGYRLSPAYDITHTPNKIEHEMTVMGNGKPKEEDLVKIVDEMKLSKKRCDFILNEVKVALSLK
jgi:serine/threonine-protein kinase HipA